MISWVKQKNALVKSCLTRAFPSELVNPLKLSIYNSPFTIHNLRAPLAPYSGSKPSMILKLPNLFQMLAVGSVPNLSNPRP